MTGSTRRIRVRLCHAARRRAWSLARRRARPSPATSFSACEKAFLRAFFLCRSGTVRTACSRSLCTCNFAKSVHFCPRLAVYHPYFDCLDHMFTVYLPFFACSRRWNAETALGRREAAKKLADTLVLDSGREAAGDSRQDSGGGCLGCRREGRRQLAQLPPEWMDSAGCCSGGGSGGGRLGLPGTARAVPGDGMGLFLESLD